MSTLLNISVSQAVPDVAISLWTSTLTDITLTNGECITSTTSNYKLGTGDYGLTNEVAFKLSDLNSVYGNYEVTPRSRTCRFFIKF